MSDAVARERRSPGAEAWIVGGAVRDRLLGRDDGRPRPVAAPSDPRTRPRALARATGRRRLPALRRVRRLARGRAGARLARRPRHRCATATSTPTSRRATSRSTRWPSRWAAASCSTRTAGAPTSRRGALRMVAPRRARRRSAAHAARRPHRRRARARHRPGDGAPRSPPTPPASTASRPSACSASSSRSSARPRRARRPRAHGARTGITAVVLPELLALRGVEQNVFHHLDVHDHTLEVLEPVAAIERDPAPPGSASTPARSRRCWREPLADELTRGQAMRFAALLHDAAKPRTRGEGPDGRVTASPATTEEGAELARGGPAPDARVRSGSRATSPRSACHHLRLGFLVHGRPLDRRARVALPRGHAVSAPRSRCSRSPTGWPRAAATPTRRSRRTSSWRASCSATRSPPPRARSRRSSAATSWRASWAHAGPARSATLLAQLEEDRFAGAITTREDALRRARELAAGR